MAAKRKIDLNDLLEQIAELPPEQQRELLQKARVRLHEPIPQGTEACGIWNEIANISDMITEEDAARLPHDGSINYKHYLYGHPKES